MSPCSELGLDEKCALLAGESGVLLLGELELLLDPPAAPKIFKILVIRLEALFMIIIDWRLKLDVGWRLYL